MFSESLVVRGKGGYDAVCQVWKTQKDDYNSVSGRHDSMVARQTEKKEVMKASLSK